MIFQYPVDMVGITQYYSSSHKALDLGYKTTKDAIYSCETGNVVKAGKDSSTGGLFVVVEHSEGWFSTYWHLSSYNVKVGQKVSKYQKIGVIGKTGNSTGIHLHFELVKVPVGTKFGYVDGKYNYNKFINKYAVNPTGYCYLYSNQTKSSKSQYTKGVKNLETLKYSTEKLKKAYLDVLVDKTVYYRTEPSTRLGNTTVVGMLSKGQKTAIEKTKEKIDNYIWVKLNDGFWVALMNDYTVLIEETEEDRLKKEIETLKVENKTLKEKITEIQKIVS